MLIGHQNTSFYVNEALSSANGSTAFSDFGVQIALPIANMYYILYESADTRILLFVLMTLSISVCRKTKAPDSRKLLHISTLEQACPFSPVTVNCDAYEIVLRPIQHHS